MSNLDDKINEKKQERDSALENLISIEQAISVAEAQDNFNNTFLFNESFDEETNPYPAVQDLIRLYYKARQIEDGTTFSAYSITEYTKANWDELLANALNSQGDGIFYPFAPGADVSASLEEAGLDPSDIGSIAGSVEGKANKVTGSGTEDKIAILTSEGDLQNSGVTVSEATSGLDQVTQAEAEAGTSTDVKAWSPADVKTAVRALGHYRYETDVLLETWVINHNLNKYPSVVVKQTDGTAIIGEVNYTSMNTLEVYFNTAVKGTAYLN